MFLSNQQSKKYIYKSLNKALKITDENFTY